MKSVLLLAIVVASASAIAPKNDAKAARSSFGGPKKLRLWRDDDVAVHKKAVEYINNQATTWTASTDQNDFFVGATIEQAKGLLGALKGGPELPLSKIALSVQSKSNEEVLKALPTSFESSAKWPHCATITEIRDQSACGSCWAVSAATVFSDRQCTLGSKSNLTLSSADLMSCCSSCGYGCGGGYPSAAWTFFTQTGIVPATCSPYPFPSCAHHVPPPPPKCPSQDYPTPPCKKQCVDGKQWSSELVLASSANSAAGEAAMMQELVNNGPIQVAFTVYSDFLTYKSGVYQHTTGQALGGHAVRIVGYGVDSNGVKYWNVANSWNNKWGDNGYFKILRGANECGIEDNSWFGAP